jgi:dUTPase
MSYKLKSNNAILPSKNYCRDVGFELYSAEEKLIPAKSRSAIETDISFTFPFGYYGLIVAIPEIAINQHIDVVTSPVENEIDSIKVILINNSNNDFIVKKSDRIALMIVNKYFDHFIMFESVAE